MATALLPTPMMAGVSSIAQVHDESVGGIARTIEDMRAAATVARLRKRRRLRLRAAVLTIDQLLEELELLNLQARSRSLSAWHRRLFALGRLDPKAKSLELTNETSPQRLVDELFELQGRLMRELAGPEWDSYADDESLTESAGHLSQSETAADRPERRSWSA